MNLNSNFRTDSILFIKFVCIFFRNSNTFPPTRVLEPTELKENEPKVFTYKLEFSTNLPLKRAHFIKRANNLYGKKNILLWFSFDLLRTRFQLHELFEHFETYLIKSESSQDLS